MDPFTALLPSSSPTSLNCDLGQAPPPPPHQSPLSRQFLLFPVPGFGWIMIFSWNDLSGPFLLLFCLPPFLFSFVSGAPHASFLSFRQTSFQFPSFQFSFVVIFGFMSDLYLSFSFSDPFSLALNRASPFLPLFLWTIASSDNS